MGIDFYYMALSAPCRAVQMTAIEYGVQLNFRNIDLKQGDHLKASFLKINPMHLIPTIDDNGFHLWESSAIMTYLANKYGGSNDTLYPKDPQKRAQVDMVLSFSTGSIFCAYLDFFAPQVIHRKAPNPELEKKLLNHMYGIETFLMDKDYLAGNHKTLADLSVLATVVSMENFDMDLSNWPKMQNWMKRMKAELPYYDEVNKEGLITYKKWFRGE